MLPDVLEWFCRRLFVDTQLIGQAYSTSEDVQTWEFIKCQSWLQMLQQYKFLVAEHYGEILYVR
jgi:hypothetical protein